MSLKTRTRNACARYVSSWWIPSATCGFFLLIIIITSIHAMLTEPYGTITTAGAIILLIAIAGAKLTAYLSLVTIIWQLCRRHWKKAAAMMAASLILAVEAILAIGLAFPILMGPPEGYP